MTAAAGSPFSRARLRGCCTVALLGTVALAFTAAPPRTADAATPAGATATSSPATAGIPGGTRVLAAGPSGFPTDIDVIGATENRVAYGISAPGEERAYGIDGTFDTVAATGGRPTRIGGGGLRGSFSVAGSTMVYLERQGVRPYWADLATGRGGPGRAGDRSLGDTWQTAVPGGGAWVDTDTSPARLVSTTTAYPDAVPTVLATLPPPADGGAVAAADTHGIAVLSASALSYYSFATRTMRTLDTGGAAAGGLTCTSATAAAIGCFNDGEVLRVPTNGAAPTAVRVTGVDRVAVGPTMTAWTVDAGRVLATDVGGRITHTSVGHVSGIAAIGDDIAFARVDAHAGGIYRTAGAGSAPRLLYRVPPLPRTTFGIALTAGRVAWLDDSTVTYPVRSRRLLRRRPGRRFTLSPTVVVARASAGYPAAAADVALGALAVSGSRSLFLADPHRSGSGLVSDVVLADPAGHRVVGTTGWASVALSGSRALWRTPGGHLVLRNLLTGSTRDLSAVTGGDTGIGTDLHNALYGRYLAYARDGWIWRLDLAAGRSVRVGRAGGARTGLVVTAGDWVAWQHAAAPSSPIFYRNARTLGPVRTVRGGRILRSVAQAGFVARTAVGRWVFRRWGTTADRGLPAVDPTAGPAATTISADGGLVAWIGAASVPEVAPLAASAARPQALGAPFAAARILTGRVWTFDQPTSQTLTTCTVVIRNPVGAVVTRLRCAPGAAAQGEAVVSWGVGRGSAPAGTYAWQLVAGDGAGSVLSSTGTPGAAVRGTVLVMP